jgi:hypothetical protein
LDLLDEQLTSLQYLTKPITRPKKKQANPSITNS